MTRFGIIAALCGIWAALYAASILVPYHTPPSGDGFARGLNRVTLFFQYQMAAGALAMAIWWMGRGLARRWQQWAARMPAILALLLLALGLGVIAVANLGKPRAEGSPPGPDRPVTESVRD